MFQKTLLVTVLSLAAVLSLFVTESLWVRALFGFIFLLILIFFLFSTVVEGGQKGKYEQLKKAYEDLDKQSNLIVRTDLELRKAQEELDKRIDGLTMLHELGRSISRSFNVENSFSHLTTSFISKLGFEKSLITLFEEQMQRFGSQARVGYSEKEAQAIQQRLLEDTDLRAFLQSGKSLTVHRKGKISPLSQKFSEIFHSTNFILVPLVVKEKAVGFIFVGKEVPYEGVTEGDRELVSILANQMSQTMENSLLYEQVWQSHRELEKKVKERTLELAKANEELKRISKMKSDFVSNVSHELRTPLTSIKGYASILGDGKLGAMTDNQKQRLHRIDEQTNRLTQLVDDLLDISRIESGKVVMDFAPVSAQSLLENPLDLLEPQIREKHLTLHIEKDEKAIEVWVDREKMERVLLNLLGNAVKFTLSKGQLTVQISNRKGSVQFDITDTGIGIEAKEIPHLFEEFFRSENAVRQNIKGTGLGLSLVKRVIDAHEGKIWVKSKVGEGSTFSFSLPLKPKTQATAA